MFLANRLHLSGDSRIETTIVKRLTDSSVCPYVDTESQNDRAAPDAQQRTPGKKSATAETCIMYAHYRASPCSTSGCCVATAEKK
jgi:hypothetical protein